MCAMPKKYEQAKRKDGTETEAFFQRTSYTKEDVCVLMTAPQEHIVYAVKGRQAA